MSTTMQTQHQPCPHTVMASAIAHCFLPPGSTLREHLKAVALCSALLDYPGNVSASMPTDASTRFHELPHKPARAARTYQHHHQHIAQLFVTDPAAPRDERVIAFSSTDQHDFPTPNNTNAADDEPGPLRFNHHAPTEDTAPIWTCSANVQHTNMRALLRLSILDNNAPTNPTTQHLRRLLVNLCAPRMIQGPLTDELARRAALRRLSPRDQALIPPLIEGLSRPKIAHTLGLSTATVRHRTTHVYAALGVRTRRELIEWWRSPASHHHTTITHSQAA